MLGAQELGQEAALGAASRDRDTGQPRPSYFGGRSNAEAGTRCRLRRCGQRGQARQGGCGPAHSRTRPAPASATPRALPAPRDHPSPSTARGSAPPAAPPLQGHPSARGAGAERSGHSRRSRPLSASPPPRCFPEPRAPPAGRAAGRPERRRSPRGRHASQVGARRRGAGDWGPGGGAPGRLGPRSAALGVSARWQCPAGADRSPMPEFGLLGAGAGLFRGGLARPRLRGRRARPWTPGALAPLVRRRPPPGRWRLQDSRPWGVPAATGRVLWARVWGTRGSRGPRGTGRARKGLGDPLRDSEEEGRARGSA